MTDQITKEYTSEALLIALHSLKVEFQNDLEGMSEEDCIDELNDHFELSGIVLGKEWQDESPHNEYLLHATEIEQIDYLIEQLNTQSHD